MDFNIRISVALVAAIVAGEVISFLWYSHNTPWGRRMAHRNFISAVLCDIGLAVILQWIVAHKWSVYKLEDALWLSGCFTLCYACLEAPHAVYNVDSLSNFFMHALHKFCLVLTMVMTMLYLKDA